VKGNHDAASLMSRDLPYPETIHVFPSDKATTLSLDDHRVALHGRSFPNRLTSDFVQSYPARREGWLNIGVLHTSLDGSRGHEGYAPCSIDELKLFGYDYWALGHVHSAEIVSRDPWVVYPGNLQGRSVREIGAKGAMRVTVDNGRVIDVKPLELDHARWAHLLVDVNGAETEADIVARAINELEDVHSRSGGRPLAVRITLTGPTDLHNQLVTRRELIQDDIRAAGFRIAEDCWIEQLKIKTSSPPRSSLEMSASEMLDVDNLLTDVVKDPEFGIIISELIATIKDRLPRDLRDELSAADFLNSLSADARALLIGEAS